MSVRSMCLLSMLGWFLCGGCRSDAEAPAEPNGADTKSAMASPAAAKVEAAPGSIQSTVVRNTPQAAGPKWACDELSFDFGSVYAGAVVRHPFKFRNVGNQVLQVLQIKPRCSCSVAESYTRSLKPGEAGIIPFRLNTQNKEGFLDEWLEVSTNDPARPKMTIRLNGVVKTVCSLEVISDAGAATAAELKKKAKMRGAFGRIKSTDRLHRVIRMTNKTPQPLSLALRPIRPSTSRFKADLKEVRPGQEFELTIIGEPPFPEGSTFAALDFVTNISDQPMYTVRVSGYVPPRIEVMPPKIVVGVNSWNIKKRSITITNNGTSLFKVTKVAVSNPDFKLSLQPPDPAKPNKTVINVPLPPGNYRPPPYGEVVRIETTDAEKPVIEIFILPSMTQRRTSRPADKPLTFHLMPMPGD